MNLRYESNDNSVTLQINGDLLSTNTESVRKDADKILADSSLTPQRWAAFRLDLTKAAMVDSAGLNLVVSLLKRVRARGATMQIAYSDPNLLRTFVFTRLDQEVELVKV